MNCPYNCNVLLDDGMKVTLDFGVMIDKLKKYGQGRGSRYRLEELSEGGDLFAQSSEHLPKSSEHYDLDSEHYNQLEAIANPVKEKGRANKELVRSIILNLCSVRYLTLRTLSDLLQRKPDSLRNHYINPMLKEGLIVLRYPNNPNHPQQGYKTVTDVEKDKL